MDLDAEPSDDAWGTTLCDPILVNHQSRLVLFARASGAPVDALYFRVLDPAVAASVDDATAWNGWYRYTFPESQAVTLPQNTEDAAETPARELRLAGMDLLTVTPDATTVRSGDASFRVMSEGPFLSIVRVSQDGTLLLNRLALHVRKREVSGVAVQRFWLEPAWEVRFRRSGLRDVPQDQTDGQSCLDPVGKPFYEPTIELARVSGVTHGRYDVVRVATMDSEVSVLYVAVATDAGVQLHQVRRSTASVTDYVETPIAYPLIEPKLELDGSALVPIGTLAPALVFYAEQEASSSGDDAVELQRAAHLMLAIPVEGGGLTAAMAIYDFALDRDGNIPVLPAGQQSLALVDGTLAGGSFSPDETQPVYPGPVQVVDGLVVSSMVLGQVQPQRSPVLHCGDDGLVHLYYGGPCPVPPFPRWSSLDPALPQALVAQFDVRANRLVLSVPWSASSPQAEPSGAVEFVARQSGSIMDGATISITDGTLGPAGPTAADLCTVTIAYPARSGLPAETWTGVPRELGAFMDVLNGRASADSADPAALAGTKPFFDASGTLALVRPPLSMPPDTFAGPAPAVTFVSTRPGISLVAVDVTATGSLHDYALTFEARTLEETETSALTVHWRSVPTEVPALRNVFDGAAGAATYAYPPDTDGAVLFGLVTDAVGVDAPVLVYSRGTNPRVAELVIEVRPSSELAGALDVDFRYGEIGISTITKVPADVHGFVTALGTHSSFKDLGLGISGQTAAGRVQTTNPPVTRMGLAATSVLFDVLIPSVELGSATVTTGHHVAGAQSHTFGSSGDWDRSRMAGLVATSVRPAAGATAYVQNTSLAGPRRSLSRTLGSLGDTELLASGVWVRPPVPQRCSFSGTDCITVPVVSNDGAVVPASTNLCPQQDWTLEAWIRPECSTTRQRVLTFQGGPTPGPVEVPELAYAVAITGQKVAQAAEYTKTPGKPDSSFFQTGTSSSFIPARGFTWEVWVSPNATPAPAGALGSIFQVGPSATPYLAVGLTADRRLQVVTRNASNVKATSASAVQIPSAEWTHVALVGEQDDATKRWTLRLFVDAKPDETFGAAGIELANLPQPALVIGTGTTSDVTMFGKISQLRYWGIARAAADIRRTCLASLCGDEPGLLGNWPLTVLETKGSGAKLACNTAVTTGTILDAQLFVYPTQSLGLVDDSVWLSLVGSVGGSPPIEADARLGNGRWNHLALVYRAGGALSMNLPWDPEAESYQWASCGRASELGGGSSFAIDAYIEVPTAPRGTVGTIIARWASKDDEDQRSFLLGIDEKGELELSVVVMKDYEGNVEVLRASSKTAHLADATVHHVAVVFESQRASGDAAAVEWSITFHRDGEEVGRCPGSIAGIETLTIRSTEAEVTLGCAYRPGPSKRTEAPESFAYLHAKLGELRFWSTAPALTELFPERYTRIRRMRAPKGIAACWSFREQSGRIAADSIGGHDARLSSSSLWAPMAATSRLAFVANGGFVWDLRAASSALEPVSPPQFTMGAPVGSPSVAGFQGQIAQVCLYDQARSVETIQAQMYTPRSGSESSLIACWNFASGGADATGGQNDAVPAVPASRLGPSTAPLSSEGPYVRNVYGGVVTDLSQSAPGRMAVGSYADAQDVGTPRQRAVLERQYVVDPEQELTRAVQIGELELTYVGQVQTDPTLIGYIEGAPPVPSENLTRPYYSSPKSAGYMRYLDTSKVTLEQEAAESLELTSSSAHTTDLGLEGEVGAGVKLKITLLYGGIAKLFFKLNALAGISFKVFGEWGHEEGEKLQATFGAAQQDTVGLTGDWEPYQADPARYLNPQVGRRFVPANLGYALVESLTADLYAITFGPSRAALGTMVLPNPSIPPDRNILMFPMQNDYTKAGTLDGKIGLVNDPDYPTADVMRGSYFKPVEAYALAAGIDQQRERSRALVAQLDPRSRARASNTNLPEEALPFDSSGAPVQGLVNRYVWTADGGLHAETQRMAAVRTRSYSGKMSRGGGGGFKAEGKAVSGDFSVEASLDLTATHKVDVQVSKENESEHALSLDVSVDGETYLRTFDPNAPEESCFLPGDTPGKVKAYRFMTFYLPPSARNSAEFSSIVDEAWRQLSNEPNARALRELDASAPSWRVLHRVTYVERVPPSLASRPLFVPASATVAPVNVEGNAELIRLVDAQLPPGVERTMLVVGNAVAAVLDPPPGAGKSKLEELVPWWGQFLARARAGANGEPQDPKAATLLHDLVARTTTYLHDGYACGAFDAILQERSSSSMRGAAQSTNRIRVRANPAASTEIDSPA